MLPYTAVLAGCGGCRLIVGANGMSCVVAAGGATVVAGGATDLAGAPAVGATGDEAGGAGICGKAGGVGA